METDGRTDGWMYNAQNNQAFETQISSSPSALPTKTSPVCMHFPRLGGVFAAVHDLSLTGLKGEANRRGHICMLVACVSITSAAPPIPMPGPRIPCPFSGILRDPPGGVYFCSPLPRCPGTQTPTLVDYTTTVEYQYTFQQHTRYCFWASDVLAYLEFLSKADGEKSCPDSRLKPDFA